MKTVCNSLVLFAASVVIAGAAPVPDAPSASVYHERLTNSIAPMTLSIKAEPEFVLGPNTRLTGLFVDCAMPQQTWDMLNPSVPSRNPQQAVPPSLLPVMPLRSISNPAVHEADFAVLRLSFP